MKNPNYTNLLIEWFRDSGVSEIISETRHNYYLKRTQNKVNQKNAGINKTQTHQWILKESRYKEK